MSLAGEWMTHRGVRLTAGYRNPLVLNPRHKLIVSQVNPAFPTEFVFLVGREEPSAFSAIWYKVPEQSGVMKLLLVACLGQGGGKS